MNVVNGCAVRDHQMLQDVCFTSEYEHASEFVLTVLDVPGAQASKSRDPQCQPQAQLKAGEMERSHNARLASLFSKT